MAQKTETITVNQSDLKLFLDALENGIGCTCLPRDVRKRFKDILEEEREWVEIYELAE